MLPIDGRGLFERSQRCALAVSEWLPVLTAGQMIRQDWHVSTRCVVGHKILMTMKEAGWLSSVLWYAADSGTGRQSLSKIASAQHELTSRLFLRGSEDIHPDYRMIRG